MRPLRPKQHNGSMHSHSTGSPAIGLAQLGRQRHRRVHGGSARLAQQPEVAAEITKAAAADLTIRMAGSGHSFTPTAVTDGVLLRPDRLTSIRSVDSAAGTVTVEAGCPLHVLNAELLARGLSLANMGDIQVQTVAGAIQTGTHGTGRDVGGMAAQVAGLELALADGSIVTCSAESPSGGLTFSDGTAR